MRQITLSRDAIHRGTLILVNAGHKVAWDTPEGLLTVGADVQLERQAATLLEELMQEIGGWESIVPVSGWRSMAEQQAIWDSCLQESGPEYTRTYVAVPGHSEHQTGLAIDLGLRQEHIDFICPEFPDTGICGQFKQRAADYGFILRYPAEKECITGIGCEPWHFRYVGVPHARIMVENHQTLEEYTEYIKQFDSPLHPYCIRIRGRAIYVSYTPAKSEETTVEVIETAPCQISGNNVDGFVLTQWT